MSIANIEKQVLDAARAEADEIIDQAQQAAQERLEEAETEHAARTERAVEAARTALQRKLDQEVTANRAANKLAILSKKAALLDDAFARAVERFAERRDETYQAWLRAQLDGVADQAGELRPATADRDRVAAALDELKQAGQAGGLELGDANADARGGFVLAGDAYDMDLTLDRRLEALKAELLPELAKRAFDEA
jgi:vacuolar-type H+-ATPase subunit E/Vma4